jgi:hypothetical protein
MKRMEEELYYGDAWSIRAECSEMDLKNGNKSVHIHIVMNHGLDELTLVDKTEEIFPFMLADEMFNAAKSEVRSLLEELAKIGANTRTRNTRYIENAKPELPSSEYEHLYNDGDDYPLNDKNFSQALERLSSSQALERLSSSLRAHLDTEKDNFSAKFPYGLLRPIDPSFINEHLKSYNDNIESNDWELTADEHNNVRIKIGKGFEKAQEQLKKRRKQQDDNPYTEEK